MIKRLDTTLCKKYPEIFAERYDSMTTTAMCWGIDCNSGWFNIIDQLCSEIMQCCGDRVPVAKQVKEKHGGLCFYIDAVSEAVSKAILKAEQKALKTCEVCGMSGKLKEKNAWYKTLCSQDAERLGFAEVN